MGSWEVMVGRVFHFMRSILKREGVEVGEEQE